MASAKTREYSFDVVKFLAISIIVLHHYQEVTGAFFQYGPNWYDGAFYWGYLVELFFIISGYFTFASIEKVRSGVSFGAFYIRKYLRFLPMIVICGVVCLVTKYLCLTYVDHEPNVSFTMWNVISSLACVARWFDTSLMINNPMWYVSVLLLCLVVFYFATRRCRKAENLVLVYGIVIALGLVMRSMCADGFKAPFFNTDIARGLISFFYWIGTRSGDQASSPSREYGKRHCCDCRNMPVCCVLCNEQRRTCRFCDQPVLCTCFPRLSFGCRGLQSTNSDTAFLQRETFVLGWLCLQHVRVAPSPDILVSHCFLRLGLES